MDFKANNKDKWIYYHNFTRHSPHWRPSLWPGALAVQPFQFILSQLPKQIVHAFVSQHWKQSRHLTSPRQKYIWTQQLHSLRKNKILILTKTKTPDQITNHWKIQHSSGGLVTHRYFFKHLQCLQHSHTIHRF